MRGTLLSAVLVSFDLSSKSKLPKKIYLYCISLYTININISFFGNLLFEERSNDTKTA